MLSHTPESKSTPPGLTKALLMLLILVLGLVCWDVLFIEGGRLGGNLVQVENIGDSTSEEFGPGAPNTLVADNGVQAGNFGNSSSEQSGNGVLNATVEGGDVQVEKSPNSMPKTGVPRPAPDRTTSRADPCRGVIPATHYDGTCARRPIQDDLISPIDFKLSADFHFGALQQPAPLHPKCKLTQDVIPRLWDGVVIFVDSPAVAQFVKDFLPRFTSKFVFVSGDSDESNPIQIDHRHVVSVLQNQYLLHWYAMNCDHNPNPQMFTCLFNGISQWNGQRDQITNALQHDLGITCDLEQNLTNPKSDGEGSVIVAYGMTNPPERQPAWDHMCNNDSLLRPMSLCYNGVDIQTHYRRMSRSRFVVSPHGVGLDCYRTYEALYLGSYPIVKKSSLDEMYKGLPVLIVDSWSEITPKLLDATYVKFRSMSFDYQRLFKWYWFKKFRSHLVHD